MEHILPKGNITRKLRNKLIKLYPEFKHYQEHSSHKMIITKFKFNYNKQSIFVVENSWGDHISIINIPISTIIDMMETNQCTFDYIYLNK